MPRNLDRRVEILFPLEDESCKAQAIHILDVQMADTMKAHVLGSDNTYEKVDLRGKAKIGAQDTLMKEALSAPFASSAISTGSMGLLNSRPLTRVSASFQPPACG